MGEIPAEESPCPLRLLVVVSSPSDVPDLNSEKEIGVIQEVMDPVRRKCLVEIDYLETATLSNLRSKLSYFEPHILHYTGHGGKLPFSGETYLAFENDDGELKPLFGEDLRRVTAGCESLKLVVLSGCMTGQSHLRDAQQGIGTSLLLNNLPAVLAIQYSILDASGIAFAGKFYESIGRGASLSRAVQEVRFLLYDKRGKDRADWGLPALYLRTPEVRLINTKLPRSRVQARHEQVDIGGLPIVRGFVGRKKEIRQVRYALGQSKVPVIYIYGLGGVGKTALTAKVIEKVDQDKTIDAACVLRCDKIDPTFAGITEKLSGFISLQGKENHAKAGALLKESRLSIDQRISYLNSLIKDSPFLFVFDNFESLFKEQAPWGELKDKDLTQFFSTLFDHNWHSTFLFTSRYQWQLLSPHPDKPHALSCGLPVENYLCIQLPPLTPHQTVQHMNNLAGPLSKLTITGQQKLLSLVQGHPKTIELLDSYLHTHTLAQVLGDQHLKGKVIEEIGAYFMDGLWQNLDNAEQKALENLAIFRTPLTEEDIITLVPGKTPLVKLKSYSLLQQESEGKGFIVHPVVREYVLAKAGKKVCVQLHKSAADFLVHKHDELLNMAPEEMRDRPVKVLCGIMKMLRQRGMREQADAMVNSLLEIHYHLFEAGEYEDAGDIVTAIWAYLDMQGLKETAKELLNKSIGSREGIGKYAAMGNLATLLNDEGKWEEALKGYQECLTFFKSIHATSQMAVAISQQAIIYRQRGKYEKALELEQKALVLKEETGNKEGITISHYRIAQLFHMMERYDEALEQGEKGLALVRELRNKQLEGAFLHQQGLTLDNLNRPQEAFTYFSDSLTINEKIGDKAGQADSLTEIGKLCRRAGQYRQALECMHKALNIRQELGDPVKVAISLETIGTVFEDQGHFKEALIRYKEALMLYQQYGSPQNIDIIKQLIAQVQKKMGT